MIDVPVTFAPGRARLATSPLSTGSVTSDMTIGIVLVTCLAALVAAPPIATMTRTLRRTKSAARAGYRTFDFGRSREGTGAYHFKRHWGFEPTPLPYQYVLLGDSRMPDLSPSNPKMRLAVNAWKRLPLPLTKVIGPRLTRYLP